MNTSVFPFTERAPRAREPFDPEASARLTGHEHEIPPSVRRLSADEIHALFPAEFHELRGRKTCGCAEQPVVLGRPVVRLRVGALGGRPW